MTARRRLAIAAAGPVRVVILLSALLTASCAVRPGDILLVTIDTLRPDHLSLLGYPRRTTPNLERWFAGAAIFERAYATEASTPPSVVSILSGRLPQEHRVRLYYQLLPNDARILPDLLPERYQTAAFVSNAVLTNEAMGFAARFDHYDDFVDSAAFKDVTRTVYERNARDTTDAALRWLDEHRDPSRPLFLWVHYIDPHRPYGPPTDWPRSFTHEGQAPIPRGRITDNMRDPEITDGLTYVDRYDEEIAYTDAQVGRLLEGYARRHPIDDALVVFTADHGETMMEHQLWFAHGYQVHDAIVRVPLFIRGPGVVPGRRTGLVSGIDVVPTALAFAGVAAPASLGGIDLARPGTVPEDRIVFTEAAAFKQQWRAAIQGGAKWAVGLARGDGTVTERRLYDLAADPGESTHALWPPEDGAAARRLLELCRADPDPGGLPLEYRKGVTLAAPKVAPRADEAARARLRALGYVE